MDITKDITLKGLNGSDIIVTYKTTVSEWDTEQVESALLPAMQYDPIEKKAKIDYSNMGLLMTQRIDRLIEVFVTKWSGEGEVTTENLKKTLTRDEFRKLTNALDAVYDGETLDSKKKENLPNSLSEVSSTPTSTSPENSTTHN